MWALAECDVAHERIDAGGRYGRTDTPGFKAMSPLRQVPVWQEEDFAMCESHAILRHLGRGPAAKLWPDDPAGRAKADQWMEFTTNSLLPPLIGVFFQNVRLPEAKRSAALREKHLKALDAAVQVLDRQLAASTWLVGDQLTLADIAAGSPMFRYHDMDIPRADYPALSDWYKRLSERPAYRDSVMTSYDELRPT